MTSDEQSSVNNFTSARELLALNVIRMRRQLRWTQEELAHAAKLDRSFLAHVERRARNVSLDNIERLAAAFGIPIAELFSPVADCGAKGQVLAAQPDA